MFRKTASAQAIAPRPLAWGHVPPDRRHHAALGVLRHPCTLFSIKEHTAPFAKCIRAGSSTYFGGVMRPGMAENSKRRTTYHPRST